MKVTDRHRKRLPALALVLMLFPALAPVTRVLSDEGGAAPEADAATVVEIQTGKAIRATLHHYINVYGVVEPEPAGDGRPAALARLSPAVAGVITEANGTEGQKVSKGDVLFRLDTRAADAVQAQAEIAANYAASEVERQKALLKVEGTSEKSVRESEQALAGAQAELAAAKVQLSLLQGEAPLSGTLTKFSARPGEAADATTILAEIVDLDRLAATVNVPQNEADDLKTGQAASLRPSSSGPEVKTVVSYVSPEVDTATGTVKARLKIPASSGLRPGQFVAAAIATQEKPGCLAVPREAVYTNPEGQSTLCLVTGDTAKRITVETGLRDGDLIEVEGDGLTEGATVATVGSYSLPDETKVHVSAP